MTSSRAIARLLGLFAAVVLAAACANGTDAVANEQRSASSLGEMRVASDEAVQIRSITALGTATFPERSHG